MPTQKAPQPAPPVSRPLPPPATAIDRYTPTALVRLPTGQGVMASDLATCKSFIKRHSKSFYFSSLLLPRARRHEAWALYAFCRQADDSVDGENTGDGAISAGATGADSAVLLQRVDGLRQRLRHVYSGRPGQGPNYAIDRAFYQVVERTALPSGVPERLLYGMELDARGVHYATWAELYDYCFSVAATVGLMMTYLLGHRMPAERHAEVMLRACDLGIAMQLTNIARDVGEDALRGRVYLPEELLAEHGLSADAVRTLATLRKPAPPPLRKAVSALLARADAHYAAARQGIPMLVPEARLSIRSAESIYRAIGERLAAQGYDPLQRRVFLPLSGKLWRLISAYFVGRSAAAQRLPTQLTQGPADALLLRLCQAVGVAGPR